MIIKYITRREAIKKGIDTYYVKPCRKKHTEGRFVLNSKCIKCEELKNDGRVKEIIDDVKKEKVNNKSIKFKNDTKALVGYVLIAGIYCKKYDRTKKKKHLKK